MTRMSVRIEIDATAPTWMTSREYASRLAEAAADLLRHDYGAEIHHAASVIRREQR